MAILRSEEKKLSRGSELSSILEKAWDTRAYWYGLALATTSGLFWLFDNKIHPLFRKGFPSFAFYRELTWFWDWDREGIISKKVDDKASYDSCLQQEFSGPTTGSDLDPDGARQGMQPPLQGSFVVLP
ncbi:hypothetical protein P175DRAFT_080690 [Aspergillus ochraceoroseus IBT 24754]|nr:uncharacterized protein P175DRAFT_080690 [Aspergillus ochraceoroseus IBT 24754]PTU25488.1 hypothetical protein P175DRAFT_080690 [Aspergillus ochraceoroseus IBT 24754]